MLKRLERHMSRARPEDRQNPPNLKGPLEANHLLRRVKPYGLLVSRHCQREASPFT